MSISDQTVILNTGSIVLITTPVPQLPPYCQSVTISIQNTDSANSVFIGDNNVSTTQYGYKLEPKQSFTIDLHPSDQLYAVANGASVAVGIMREYL